MSMKSCVWGGMFVGSTVGSFVPLLWGADLISFSSILVSSLGAAVGVWGGYMAGKYLGV